MSSVANDIQGDLPAISPASFSQEQIKTLGLSLVDAFDRHCGFTTELGQSDRLAPDGTPFSLGRTYRSPREAWSDLCGLIENEQIHAFGRKNDPTQDWSHIPPNALAEFSIADLDRGNLDGPHDIKFYDVRFIAKRATGGPHAAAAATAAPPKGLKRGPKPVDWDPAMQGLLLRLISEENGLPKSSTQLVLDLVVENSERPGASIGKETRARDYLLDNWKWLYDACANQRR